MLNSPLYTDLYQLTMGQAYFLNNRHNEPACFDYFFRKQPFNGGYVVFAGLGELLDILESLTFDKEALHFLESSGFHPDYLEFLSKFHFRGNIHGMREGEVVFPFEPIVRVEGGLFETQLVETLLLNWLNFQSLIATKARRVRRSAGDRILSDFGLRRAQGLGGVQASRAAYIGGFDSTSNMMAAQQYNIPMSGTMAHSFIETYDGEKEAFRAYAKVFPDQCTLLVDTYNTLSRGIPNAIAIAREMQNNSCKLAGIRLDSGDLAYLSKRARTMLDEAGLHDVRIVVSNQLDEYVIKSLLEQGAQVDVFGVGTSMIIGRPDGAVDGVYKLAASSGKPRMKISENLQKTTLPGVKKVYRFSDHSGKFHADCISLKNEALPDKMIHPFQKEKILSLQGYNAEELFCTHMEEGQRTHSPESLKEIRERVDARLQQLPDEHQRFDYPHIYKVGISEQLMHLREETTQKVMEYRG